MNDNAKKWVDLLRSGAFEQGTITLSRQRKFCCLGVACELAIRLGLQLDVQISGDGTVRYDDSECGLPDRVRDLFGLSDTLGVYVGGALFRDNDNGKTFLEIADIIESEPEGLFVRGAP